MNGVEALVQSMMQVPRMIRAPGIDGGGRGL
jgi:hypothetical protein